MKHLNPLNGMAVGWRGLTLALAATVAWGLPGVGQAQADRPEAVAVCVACHGEDGNSAIPMFPKIAGLQESYILKQLRDFQSGRRKSDVMAPVVAALKIEDLAPIAAYYSGRRLKAGSDGDRKLVGFGKMIYLDGNEETGVPACVGCHQPLGAGQGVYPRIGGQHTQYLKQQLKNFAAAERNNDVSRFMRVIAKRMSDEEIESVAAYLTGLDKP